MVKDIEINLKVTEDQHREIRMYLDSLTIEMILSAISSSNSTSNLEKIWKNRIQSPPNTEGKRRH